MATDQDTDAPTLPVFDTTHLVSIQGGRIDSAEGGASLQVGPDRRLIGRARRCDLVLDDPTVSAVHAEVQATPKGVRLVDLGSRNGTFIRGAQLLEVYLTGACEFRCGGKRLRFVPGVSQERVLDPSNRFGGVVGTTPEMLELFGVLRRYAPSSLSIVIHGETGTGKERVARAIHEASPRRHKPFLSVNCAAMPDAMLEAELFGHARGAFPGAERDREGLLVEADGGTLFIDHVAEMSLAIQAKLLRALESQEIRPLGSARSRKIDVRTLFATHADLRHALNHGRFREGLYFLIAKVTVELPPLRTRMQDIGLLLEDILQDLGRPGMKFDEPGMAMLMTRSWRGNVRELKNLVEIALVGSTGEVLSLEDALPAVHQKEEVACGRGLYDAAKKEFERHFYTGLYAVCQGNVSRIAKVSGRQRVTVREALRSLGLDVGPEAPTGEDGTRSDLNPAASDEGARARARADDSEKPNGRR
jgi:transcriptional regulator with AAA-type ATPase domain